MSTSFRTHWLLIVCVTCTIFGGLIAIGHDNDPKARDRQPPYTGPGYRSALPGPQPFGPVGGFPSDGINLEAWIPLPEMQSGISNGNDCWGYTSPSGREYALMAHSSGTTVVEVTNPGNPNILGTITGPNSLWRDVKTYQNFAYAVSEGGGGIQVIDLSDVDNGNIPLTNTITTGGGLSSHNVAIDTDSGYLYRCGGGGNGLRFYNLNNPGTPVFEGSWTDRYVHDAQIVEMQAGPFAGSQVAFLCTGNGPVSFDILDITNKANVILLGQLIYPGGAYSHQGWLSPDQQHFYLGDELDEGPGVPTKPFVIDVSDLTNPILMDEYTNGNSAIGHNIYTVDNLVYEANYRSGLRILDGSNPLNMTEVAYFDTYPADDNSNFNGLWSVYPYFPSGTIIGSDLERGLFVWSVGATPLTFSYPAGLPDQLNPFGDSLTVQIVPGSGFVIDTQSTTLWFNSGSGWMSSLMNQVAPGSVEYLALFPAFDCGTDVQWYVEASVIGGGSTTDPPAAPVSYYSAPAMLGVDTLLSDDMEQNPGWTVGAAGDNATTGVWTRVAPIGTDAQPSADHSVVGTNCWVTGQGSVGGALGENDVDGGVTTLISPNYDLSAASSPIISYWRWFSNNSGAGPGTDTFRVDISANGGATWTSVEVIGPTGNFTSGGWFQHQFQVEDFVALSATVRLRFRAEDVAAASIVEAAIDDLVVGELFCNDCNGNGVADDQDIASGTSQDSNSDGTPDECQCTPWVRGELNDDGTIDLSDAVTLLIYLFSGGPTPDPESRGDVNDSGQIDVADVIYLVEYLFAAGSPPPAPFPNPGGCP
ncbi:MAG: choice-of-anchor B family protein [Planctomycetes bacterium]|nr:choice-of-anchor B family protein [Planctomycetota bacterium]